MRIGYRGNNWVSAARTYLESWQSNARRNRRQNDRRTTRTRQLESLEARQVLAVVISEFMASNQTTLADDAGKYSDWIELHNTGATAVNLDGWFLTDNATNLDQWEFPAVSIAANGYVTVFASGSDHVDPALPLHTNFKLDAGGEYLGLVQADGTTVASEYAPEFPKQSDDVSYGISSNGVDVGYFSSATPGAANGIAIPDSAKAVVISEIMYSLPRADILTAEDIGLEFIELTNRSTKAIDVTGWQLTKGVDYTFPTATIPAGGRIVVAADKAAFTAHYGNIANVYGNWVGRLSNSGETIEVVDANGGLVDDVTYSNEGDWAQRILGPNDAGWRGWEWFAAHDGGGMSLELINLNMSNDNGQNWASSQNVNGTPGQPNSVAAVNIAPVVTSVKHEPILPHSDEPVTITAKVADDSSSSSTVRLHWRTNATGNFTVVTMFDDGVHGDGLAGDGKFGATIPAQANLAVVEFYVEAQDTTGLTRTWPAANDQGQTSNALYQVYNAFDLEQEWNPGDPAIYHVIMTPADRTEFDSVGRNDGRRQSDSQFNATFIALTPNDTAVRYTVGVRFRGSGSRTDTIPNNRINIPADNPWQGRASLNINENNPDHQLTGSAMFRLAGLPVVDNHAVRLLGNGIDRKNGGVYADAEVMDSGFAENHFPTDPNGNLYRGYRRDESPPGGQGAGLVYNGESPAPYVSYDKKTNASEADWSDVIALTRILNQTTDAEFAEAVRQVVDVEQWFRAFAMNQLLDNQEFSLYTGDTAGDDYAMYRGLIDTRFKMVPYDQDSLFNSVTRNIFAPNNVPVLNR
ncbi:MAG: lamin tail domain-containing protein, partial [Planctomycetales bacterium]|nr:lamin tail domain-containing protein [Planctomycetales bacterium]